VPAGGGARWLQLVPVQLASLSSRFPQNIGYSRRI
jgi:hypothetical protein